MVSELRRLEDALGPLGGPKIFKSITFSIKKFKGIRHISGPADFAPRFGGQVQESLRMLSNHPEAKKSPNRSFFE